MVMCDLSNRRIVSSGAHGRLEAVALLICPSYARHRSTGRDASKMMRGPHDPDE
jgi:hypothetical protein